ncbi:MAG: transporter substrate-binding domain-containing protein [Campylobacterales bacterium]|nr:transporter substrate-binding domain-containing protein [Campylobacterales bacterium]
MKLLFRYALGVLGMALLALSGAARDWDEITSSGVLHVGMRDLSPLARDSNSKEYPGFLYEMAQTFAAENGLRLEVHVMDSFANYWTKDGEILTQAGRVATPDIYRTIDFAAEAFTITKPRQKLVHLSPYIDNVELFFGTNDSPLREYKDLIGKRVLLYESMSFYLVLRDALEARQIPYETTYIRPEQDAIVFLKPRVDRKDKVNLYLFPAGETTDGKLVYHYIARKFADASINDSLGIIFRLFSNSYYTQNIRPYFPVNVARTQLAWGSSHESTVLNAKIDAFIKRYKDSGAFSEQLKRYTGMSLDDYHALIEMIE